MTISLRRHLFSHLYLVKTVIKTGSYYSNAYGLTIGIVQYVTIFMVKLFYCQVNFINRHSRGRYLIGISTNNSLPDFNSISLSDGVVNY